MARTAMTVELVETEVALRAHDDVATSEIRTVRELQRFLADRANELSPQQSALMGAFAVALGVVETHSSDAEVVGKWLDAHYLVPPDAPACRSAFNEGWAAAMFRLRELPARADTAAARLLLAEAGQRDG